MLMPDSNVDSGTARFELPKDLQEVEVAPKQANDDLPKAAPCAVSSAHSKLPRNTAANIFES